MHMPTSKKQNLLTKLTVTAKSTSHALATDSSFYAQVVPLGSKITAINQTFQHPNRNER